MEHVNEHTSVPVSDARLWAGVGIGAAVWFVHLFAMYAIVALSCGRGWFTSSVLGMSELTFVLLVLTVIGVGVIGYAGITAYGAWQHLRRVQPSEPDTHYRRAVFMAFVGILLNILFGVLTLVTFVPSAILTPCR